MNRKTQENQTALFHANSAEFVELLLRAEADVNIRDRRGETPLFDAVRRESAQSVALLLDAGADVNIRNNDGKTALYTAVCEGSVKRVELLIKEGADVNITDAMGETLLFQWKDMIGRRYPTILKCIKIILHEGIKVNVRGSRGMTALTCFVKSLDFSPYKSATQTKHEKEFAMLLFAAGDTLDESKVTYMPEYLKPSAEVNLMNICRAAIRKHLLQISDINLFPRIPKLGLPSMLCQYLLYDVALDDDEGK